MLQFRSTTPFIMRTSKLMLPYGALAVGVIALSLSAMFVRWAQAPGPVTGFYRLLFSTLLLTPLFILRQRRSGSLPPALMIFPALAGIFTAMDFTLWNSSLAFTTASNATLLGNTSPLWVALAAMVLFRERLRGRFWLGLGVALTGALLVMGTDFLLHPRFGLGDMMACGAAVFYAAYQLTTQRGRVHFDPFRYTWLAALSATLVILVVNLLLKNPLTGYSAQTWLVFLATAVVSHTIGYLSISYALGHLPAHVVSPTLIAQPVLTTILAIPLLAEIPTRWQAIGGVIALSGIFLVNQSHNSRTEDPLNA
jgi:drug/metabolite transporter (DMT)-like permease